MTQPIHGSLFFGAVISLSSYALGYFLKRKFKHTLLNPLLIAVVLTAAALFLSGTDYDAYCESAKYISYFLTPATVCLAVVLYEKLSLLKKHPAALFGGIFAGSLASMATILLAALVFGFSREEYVTFLPKSVTMAIGMGVAEELGGEASLTAAAIITTGIAGSVSAEFVFKIFKIEEPIARGVALGTAAHAVGTSKAMELGSVECAMAGLSTVTAGIITALTAAVFAKFL